MTAAGDDQWVFLIDPAWDPDTPAGGEVPSPPLEAVVGGWLSAADGGIGRFHANPDYAPSEPGSPTDPVDAALHLLARGEVDSDALFAVLREGAFDVALGADGSPLIAPSPDDVPSLLVATAPAQRPRVHADDWRTGVSAAELGDLLREHRVDLLLNPGGPASTRLVGDVFAESLADVAE
ncbi:type VII secretion system-associated protein [Umezawaea sp. NPDC059074]|uniref:type VII secretion system-associated protein n=1 Tax=Umezawaea sp. NPDC059074 TaxID=3346716 RepID=UPI00367538F0